MSDHPVIAESRQHSESPLLGIVLILALSLSVLMATAGISITSRTEPDPGPAAAIDSRVPKVSLRGMRNGRLVELSDFRGKVVVVSFWAPWCRLCARDVAKIAGLRGAFAGRDLVVVGIPLETTTAKALRYADKHSAGWRQLSDPQARAAVAFGVDGARETFLVDREGMIRARWSGPLIEEAAWAEISHRLRAKK